jgi:hypothetical protein
VCVCVVTTSGYNKVRGRGRRKGNSRSAGEHRLQFSEEEITRNKIENYNSY